MFSQVTKCGLMQKYLQLNSRRLICLIIQRPLVRATRLQSSAGYWVINFPFR